MTLHIPCPAGVRALLDLFAAHGERAYLVGGCVRDALMSIPPHDWDVAVTTEPERTMELCRAAGYRVIPTGLAHGTVTVLVDSGDGSDREPVECTTCRTEGAYSDGRHPDAVTFTGRINDDLSRRDFTVNAMALTVGARDEPFEIVDLFGGQADLIARVIRCVGDPDTRLREDALRVMRAVRFAVKLGFDIEPATRDALVRQGAGLARISRERISAELQRILCSPQPERGVALLCELGLMPYVLPGGISPEGMGALSSLPCELSVRMACLLWACDADAVRINLDGLRLPNETVKEITAMVNSRDFSITASVRCARDLRRTYGELAVPVLLVRGARGDEVDALLALTRQSEAAGDCVCIRDLAVNGRDLAAIGVRSGRDMGDMLNSLLELVMEHPEKNDRDVLITEAKQRL